MVYFYLSTRCFDLFSGCPVVCLSTLMADDTSHWNYCPPPAKGGFGFCGSKRLDICVILFKERDTSLSYL